MYWYIKIADAKNKKFDEILNDILHNKSLGIDFGIKQNYNDFINTTTWDEYINNNNLTHTQVQCLQRVFNTFINEISIGDFVFLCSGSNKISYICQIDSDYYFDRSYLGRFYDNSGLCHRRKIKNIKKFETIAPKQMRGTIYKV
jgi:hypothetical protein